MTERGGFKHEKPPSFSLEAYRSGKGICVIVSGVISICECSDQLVKLKSHTGQILANGVRLTVNIFEGGTVEINGIVEEILFEYNKC